MISVEEKLNVYKNYLLRQTQTERKEQLEAAQKAAEEELNAAAIRLAEQKKAVEDRYIRMENRNAVKTVSEGKTYAKDRLLKQQKEIREDFNQEILTTLKSYLGTDLYKAYLAKCIKELTGAFKEPQPLILYINKDEKAEFDALLKTYLNGYPCTYRELPARDIGGFIARDQQERVSYDFSLLNLVQEHEAQIGLMLNQALKGEA